MHFPKGEAENLIRQIKSNVLRSEMLQITAMGCECKLTSIKVSNTLVKLELVRFCNHFNANVS
jgi:hypothetical protein